MGILNWREQFDAFFGNNALVVGVIGTIVGSVFVLSLIGRSRPH